MNALTLEEAYASWADDLVRYGVVLVGSDDAADLVADTFAQLLASASDGWRSARDPRNYLFGAVANHARMRHRSTGRQRAREQRHMALVAADSRPDARDPGGLDAGTADNRLDRALSGLTEQQRAVTYLAYWEDLTVADIATTLEVSEGTVRKQLARSRARLREALA